MPEGSYRPNVGIVLANGHGQVLWARRREPDLWQFPQGGIDPDESPEQAMYRELHEELGLPPQTVRKLSVTRGWLRYQVPRAATSRWHREEGVPYLGQQQKWFLLELLASDALIRLDAHSSPELWQWRWVGYWYPLSEVVPFKRHVYEQSLRQLAPAHSRRVRHRAGLRTPGAVSQEA